MSGAISLNLEVKMFFLLLRLEANFKKRVLHIQKYFFGFILCFRTHRLLCSYLYNISYFLTECRFVPDLSVYQFHMYNMYNACLDLSRLISVLKNLPNKLHSWTKSTLNPNTIICEKSVW